MNMPPRERSRTSASMPRLSLAYTTGTSIEYRGCARVATVSTVALTTIGSLVAYGGLGNLIKDGVNSNFRAELFTASVLCVVLAMALDVVIVGAQRLLTPWTRGAQ